MLTPLAPEINYVEGLSVRLSDHLIHVCKDVETTMCGIVIPECEGSMVIRKKPDCSRCREHLTAMSQ